MAFAQVLSMHVAAVVYVYNYVQTLDPFNPLKVKQVRFVPRYAEQGAEMSTQPAPIVTHPAKADPHTVSVARVTGRSMQSLLVQALVHVQALRYVVPDETYYY